MTAPKRHSPARQDRQPKPASSTRQNPSPVTLVSAQVPRWFPPEASLRATLQAIDALIQLVQQHEDIESRAFQEGWTSHDPVLSVEDSLQLEQVLGTAQVQCASMALDFPPVPWGSVCWSIDRVILQTRQWWPQIRMLRHGLESLISQAPRPQVAIRKRAGRKPDPVVRRRNRDLWQDYEGGLRDTQKLAQKYNLTPDYTRRVIRKMQRARRT